MVWIQIKIQQKQDRPRPQRQTLILLNEAVCALQSREEADTSHS